MEGFTKKGKSEKQRCNYLMLWVGEEGRDVFKTWNLSSDRRVQKAHFILRKVRSVCKAQIK